jgi:protein-S-isoprenylcysteine O-methyltransferase Ste14
MLGWVVCLACYPPFMYTAYGLYYPMPPEEMIYQWQNATLASVFIVLSVMSIIVYMLATLWFGVRFSNVTNRGIIRKGPYAFVRHPAYAAKNFFWWCLIFPVVIYNATHSGLKMAILQTLGLILITWIYYLRAITEERHLSADPYYREYCKQVKYRFIPGVM